MSNENDRIPPGQYSVKKLPVLHYGRGSDYRKLENTWDLRVWGEIEAEARLNLAQIRALPRTVVHADIHCVTKWTKLDTTWEGVSFREFLKHIPALKPSARFVVAHADENYTTNIPLALLLDDDVLLAYSYEGQDLAPEHGYPLRLMIPKRYFWKSAKWLRGLEFTAVDKPGFWERYGYNNNADPWKEERYTDD